MQKTPDEDGHTKGAWTFCHILNEDFSTSQKRLTFIHQEDVVRTHTHTHTTHSVFSFHLIFLPLRVTLRCTTWLLFCAIKQFMFPSICVGNQQMWSNLMCIKKTLVPNGPEEHTNSKSATKKTLQINRVAMDCGFHRTMGFWQSVTSQPVLCLWKPFTSSSRAMCSAACGSLISEGDHTTPRFHASVVAAHLYTHTLSNMCKHA